MAYVAHILFVNSVTKISLCSYMPRGLTNWLSYDAIDLLSVLIIQLFCSVNNIMYL